MDQINAFIEKATRDEQLAAKLEELTKQNAEVGEIIALAAEYGFEFTAEDLEAAKRESSQESRELSEEELDNVSGGTRNRFDPDVCPKLIWPELRCVGLLGAHHCDFYRWESWGGKFGVHHCVKGYFRVSP